MHLDLTEFFPGELDTARVQVSADSTPLWPIEQPVQAIADSQIVGTRFQDGDLLHPILRSRILQQAQQQLANLHGWGGKKVRDAKTWDLPEARLLTQRALLLFCRSCNLSSAHVTDRWANVLEQGDYSTPHTHYDAEAAVVYSLDPGDPCPATPTSGMLEIIDPRIEFCCSRRPGYPSRGILPEMTPGTMLLFPAAYLHYVKPYQGVRPRITLAWNLNPGPPPANIADNFEEQVPGVIEKQ